MDRVTCWLDDCESVLARVRACLNMLPPPSKMRMSANFLTGGVYMYAAWGDVEANIHLHGVEWLDLSPEPVGGATGHDIGSLSRKLERIGYGR